MAFSDTCFVLLCTHIFSDGAYDFEGTSAKIHREGISAKYRLPVASTRGEIPVLSVKNQ